jgi:hypothetical protein
MHQAAHRADAVHISNRNGSKSYRLQIVSASWRRDSFSEIALSFDRRPITGDQALIYRKTPSDQMILIFEWVWDGWPYALGAVCIGFCLNAPGNFTHIAQNGLRFDILDDAELLAPTLGDGASHFTDGQTLRFR